MMNYPRATMKLASSASEQNVFITYICLINDIKPNDNLVKPDNGYNRLSLHMTDLDAEDIEQDDGHIRVERSKALHELVESHRNEDDVIVIERHGSEDDMVLEKKPNETTSPYLTTSGEESESSENEDSNCQGGKSPNILKLTKMKWLTEDQPGSPDSSSPSLSPASSYTSSPRSKDSQTSITKHTTLSDKYLSTIIRLDKEHNMFGLSNITIVGSRASRKIRKDDEKPVFHQTAIVQICCGRNCCKHKSNTDLPSSLKCGGCRGCCVDPSCPTCVPYGPCEDTPCTPLCSSCPRGKCSCKAPPCPPSKCMVDCATCFGLKVALKRKPKYEPSPVELTPRSSSILHKPFAARSCHHLPQCIPPSSCFPYLMPCFWPARAGAPCSNPSRCFHNPPCPAPRRPRPPPGEVCPPKCEDESQKTKCSNMTCPGNNPSMKEAIESRFGKK